MWDTLTLKLFVLYLKADLIVQSVFYLATLSPQCDGKKHSWDSRHSGYGVLGFGEAKERDLGLLSLCAHDLHMEKTGEADAQAVGSSDLRVAGLSLSRAPIFIIILWQIVAPVLQLKKQLE